MKFYNREPFDDQKVESIRVQIANLAATGTPTDYQVFLDDLEVIPRTNNPDLFTSFYELIHDKTRSLNIHVYSGSTRHKRTYSFYFADMPKQSGELNGFDAQQMIDNKVEIETLKLKVDFSEKQIKRYEETIDELEADNERLLHENNTLRDDLKKAHSESGVASTLMQGVERVVSQFAPTKQQNALAGAPNQQDSRHGSVVITSNQFAEYMAFSSLANRFTEVEFDSVMAVIGKLAENKSAIMTTLEFLTKPNND